MEKSSRKAINDNLSKYCTFADKDAFIEVTEWTNGEGYDVTIESKSSNKNFSITYGELEAINFLTKAIDYYDK